MRRILYIFLGVFTLTACQQAILPERTKGECVLELDIACADVPVVVSRAVDADFALRILDGSGREYLYYPAGEVPRRIVLEPGLFALYAYTDNQETWHTANDGKGEGCYYGGQLVSIEEDHTTRVSMSVPMTNYAVGLKLPEGFDDMFESYQCVLKSGSREVTISEGELAYFSVADGGFSYALSSTNIDGESNALAPESYTDVQSGKMYLLNYHFGFEATRGVLEVEVERN